MNKLRLAVDRDIPFEVQAWWSRWAGSDVKRREALSSVWCLSAALTSRNILHVNPAPRRARQRETAVVCAHPGSSTHMY